MIKGWQIEVESPQATEGGADLERIAATKDEKRNIADSPKY